MTSLTNAGRPPPVVVAHSMGGLAVRRWWAEPQNATRIHHLITLATPHHGTWLSRFAMVTNARQMRLQSPWREALEARENRETRARITCYYSVCDNIVVPASSATLDGADNRHLEGVAHVEMADAQEPRQQLMRLLAG